MNSFLGSIGHRVILFSLFDLSSSSVLYESLNAMGSITEKFVFRFFFFISFSLRLTEIVAIYYHCFKKFYNLPSLR